MARAGPRLVLSEEAVRAKSGLGPHRDLAELQSLSIPGTYQEKITHLGHSLMSLTGLKSLDLSRNSLVSLEGIQYLTALESLNLYYNCISSLAEVFRLHALTELVDVDFRLNPVVKVEPDYRLFVVHLLPKLRQLDDRPVRESERKASRLHFASEDSLDSKESVPASLKEGRPCRPRAKCTEALAKQSLVMDADDEAVLNLIAECEWDLGRPPGSTSSSQKEREADSRGSQESRHLLSPQLVQYQCGDSGRQGHETRRSSCRGCCLEKTPWSRPRGEVPPPYGAELEASRPPGPHMYFTPDPDSVDTEDSASSQKLDLSAEMVPGSLPAPGKCRKRRMPGGRFQAFSDQEGLGCLERTHGSSVAEESLSRQNSSGSRSGRTLSQPEASETEEQRSQGMTDTREPSPGSRSALPGKKMTLQAVLLETLLDLVDRSWGGCRSLHSNEAFLTQARHILSSVEEFTAAQDGSETVGADVGSLALESKSLQSRLAEQQQRHAREMSEATAELQRTRQELVSPPWHHVRVHVTGGNTALTSRNEGSSLRPHCPNHHLCSPTSPLPAQDPATPRNVACPVSQQAWSTLETAVALATFSPWRGWAGEAGRGDASWRRSLVPCPLAQSPPSPPERSSVPGDRRVPAAALPVRPPPHHRALLGAAGARPGRDFVLLTRLSGPRIGDS
nr:centrosomal protein of 72 kDa isoform X1 [Macaca nemestrina]